MASQALTDAQKDLERRRQAEQVETHAHARTRLMNASLTSGRPGYVIRNKPSGEHKEPPKSISTQAEQMAAIAACELLVKLHKLAERRRRAAERGPALPKTVKAYPTLLNAAHKANQTPAMRVYLLIRAMDQAGRGWVDIGDMRRLFTGKRSQWRIYKSERGLRGILAQGEGIFWNRTDDRLWLHMPARIAQALGCGRLVGLPVAMPVRSLLANIGLVRAHFFASYESGRRSENPISQAALADITGVSIKSQYNYNQLLKRRSRQNNVVTGLDYNHENIYALSKKHNRPIACFKDWLGKRGPAGAKYCQYRIADSRQSIHTQAPKGRTQKINRKIDLVSILEQGNDWEVIRTIHPDAVEAAKAFNRDSTIDRVWRDTTSLQPNAARLSKWQGVSVYGAITA